MSDEETGHLGVTGPRSPQWALLRRTRIPCSGGLQYLVRYRIIETPWFGMYLHDIKEPDHDYDPHDHPWPFLSIILRGAYLEQVHPHPWVDLKFHRHMRIWRAGSWHRMGTESAHRILEVQPGTWSLILRGRRRREWGFHTVDGFMPWHEYKKGSA